MSTSTAAEQAGSPTASGLLGQADSYTVLRTLISLDPLTFTTEHWGRKPLLSRAGDLPGTAERTLRLQDVDALLSERGLRTPFLRLTRDGVVQPNSVFTSGGGAGATVGDQVSDTLMTDLLLEGTTVVLQGLQRTWRPVTELVSALSAELAAPVQANAYITPPDSRGFDAHYDVHDVFVVQLSGRKHWQVHAPVHLHPLSDQPWTEHRAAVAARTAEPPLMDIVLEPGDVLYLPRGTVHGAVTREALSAHLTLGVHPVTAHSVASAALTLLKADQRLRESLPAGARLDETPGETAVEDALEALQTALAKLTPADVATALAAAVLPQTRPVPLQPLAQARAVTDLHPGTKLRLRHGLQTHLAERSDGGATLVTPQRSHDVPASEVAAIKALRAGSALTAGRLPGLAPDTSLVLAGRLLRLGIAVPA